jgi:hypothetical protein
MRLDLARTTMTDRSSLDDLEPSPAQMGDTMTVTACEWTPLDDHGTQIYVYGDQPVDIAVQIADVDDEVRQLRAALDQIDRLLDDYRGAKALREGVQRVVDRVRGVARSTTSDVHEHDSYCLNAGGACSAEARS